MDDLHTEIETWPLIKTLFVYIFQLVFSTVIVFFFLNESVNSTFNYDFSVKRTCFKMENDRVV
jgi:hypothetical protein